MIVAYCVEVKDRYGFYAAAFGPYSDDGLPFHVYQTINGIRNMLDTRTHYATRADAEDAAFERAGRMSLALNGEDVIVLLEGNQVSPRSYRVRVKRITKTMHVDIATSLLRAVKFSTINHRPYVAVFDGEWIEAQGERIEEPINWPKSSL